MTTPLEGGALKMGINGRRFIPRNPPKPVDEGLRNLIAELHPDMHYISSSADDVVSGHGPYQAQPLKSYFTQRATPKLHSEMGMPNIVTMDSLKLMMPESAMWPQGLMWGLHDFSLNGAQGVRSLLAGLTPFAWFDLASEWPKATRLQIVAPGVRHAHTLTATEKGKMNGRRRWCRGTTLKGEY